MTCGVRFCGAVTLDTKEEGSYNNQRALQW